MTIHRIRLLGDPILRARCEPITKPALYRGPGHHGRHAGDAAGLAVPLRQRPCHRRAADRRAGADGLLRDGSALAADQSRDRGHRQRGLRGLGRLLLLPQPAGPGVPGLSDPGAYQDIKGEWHEVDLEGDRAELLQHEIDHLDGVLAVDRPQGLDPFCLREEWHRLHGPERPLRPTRRTATTSYATPISECSRIGRGQNQRPSRTKMAPRSSVRAAVLESHRSHRRLRSEARPRPRHPAVVAQQRSVGRRSADRPAPAGRAAALAPDGRDQRLPASPPDRRGAPRCAARESRRRRPEGSRAERQIRHPSRAAAGGRGVPRRACTLGSASSAARWYMPVQVSLGQRASRPRSAVARSARTVAPAVERSARSGSSQAWPTSPAAGLPAVRQRPLEAGEAHGLPHVRLVELVALRVELAHVLVGQPHGERRLDQLAADLIVAPQSERTAPAATRRERALRFPPARDPKSSAIDRPGPHPPAELVVVGQTEAGDAAGGPPEREIERRPSRPSPAGESQPTRRLRTRRRAHAAAERSSDGVERIARRAESEEPLEGELLGVRCRRAMRHPPSRVGRARAGGAPVPGRRATRSVVVRGFAAPTLEQSGDVPVGEVQAGEPVDVRAGPARRHRCSVSAGCWKRNRTSRSATSSGE